MKRSLPSRRCLLPALAALGLLTGCGSPQKGDSDKLHEVRDSFVKLMDMQQEISHASATETEIKGQMATLQRRTESLNEKVQQLQGELASLDKGDEGAMQTILDLQKEGKLEAAHQGALALLRDYPLSTLRPQAQSIADTTGVELARLAEEKRQAEAAEAARIEAERQARIAKFRSHKMTASELREFLLGKDQAEVLELLGDPTARRSDIWAYVGNYAVDELGNSHGINVFFNAGRVQSVGLRPAP